MSNDTYLQASRAYRSAIRATLNKLQEAATDEDTDPDSARKYESFITIFYSIESVFHLCEIFLIDHSSISVVPNLLEWVSINSLLPSLKFQHLPFFVDEVSLSIAKSQRCRYSR